MNELSNRILLLMLLTNGALVRMVSSMGVFVGIRLRLGLGHIESLIDITVTHLRAACGQNRTTSLDCC